MKKYLTVATVLVLLGLLSSVFYNTEFYVAQSETNAQSTVSTVSSHQELLSTRGRPNLTVFVPGSGPRAAALGRELRAELAKSPLFADVVFRAGQAAPVTGDVLVVNLGTCRMTWTGVYSRATADVTATYSTTGAVNPNSNEPVQMSGDNPTVVSTTRLTVEDSARGLMSLQGYDAELGRKLARELARLLLAALQAQVA